MAEHALIGPPSRACTFKVRKKFGWTVLEQGIGYAHSEVDGGSWFIEPDGHSSTWCLGLPQ